MSEFLRDLWQFMRMRKKYWLLPIILVLMLLGGLVVVSQQSGLASLIYTIFWAEEATLGRACPATVATRSKGLFRVDFLRCTVQRSGGSRRFAAAQQQQVGRGRCAERLTRERSRGRGRRGQRPS